MKRDRVDKGKVQPSKTHARLPPTFYDGDTLSIAQSLLGKLFVRRLHGQRVSGIIVEVEAYLGLADSASHAFRGPNRRNAAMFLPAGTIYVYSIHAKYCLNVVTQTAGIGEAVLVRALEPWEGLNYMRKHRGRDTPRDLCSGPGRLCQALAVGTECDKLNLIESQEVWLEEPPAEVNAQPWSVTSSSRIGISSSQSALYRYFIDGHQCVSGLARLHQQRRSWSFAQRGFLSP